LVMQTFIVKALIISRADDCWTPVRRR
jgi:hypothetical protein